MSNTWFVSDWHWGHEKTCTTFKNANGSPLRPFANAQEMDEEMVKRHNEVVRDGDKVYMLGDVSIKKQFLSSVGRLNGSKRLIRGNHDIFNIKDYLQYFTEVYATRVLDDMILSHIPLHPESITERFGTNVHGHTHANQVMINGHPDCRYLCVSVEQINYTPISIDEVRKRIKDRRELYNYVSPTP